ncbi:CoA pyrophosphatase [Rhizorhabdus argentea]|uniref:CoA pyrophosphatase n=1 Tax=Rhizorhabdus argentea TaxID=1387174 RepID=UPI0030EE862E
MSGLAGRLRGSLAANPEPDGHAPGWVGEQVENLESLSHAAVLVPIIDAPQPRVLMTVRHAGLRAHAGQVAFPGGRIDPSDEGPIAAALREAWEEVGLPPEQVEIVGTTRSHATRTGYLITPVIAVIPDGLDLRPHEAEVSGLFEVPLDILLAEARHLRKSTIFDGIEREYYEIDWPHERIWGVTAGLIVDFAPRLRAAIRSPS